MIALALAAVVAATAPAAPSEAADPVSLAERHSPEPGEVETDNGVSARLIGGVSALAEKGIVAGAGVAYERDFFHGLIAVELAGEVLFHNSDSTWLLEAVVEKPVAINDTLTAYFGGGPTVLVHTFESGRTVPGWGGLTLAGVEAEVGGGFEVFAETDLALIWIGAPVLEIDVGTGVMFRF
jgi:hypothetical protein